MSDYQPLTVTELFADMTTLEFQTWCGQWTMADFPAGTILLKPYQLGQVLFLLYSGRVELYQWQRGEKKILRTVGPGAIFGQMPLIGQSPNCFMATTAASKLVVLSRAAVEQLVRQRPLAALKMLEQAGPAHLNQKQSFLNKNNTKK